MWKVAIVDDDRQVLNGMRKAIPWEELGAEWAGEAMNGEDGVRMIRETNPDLVVTDIYMPVMNGLDMIEQLRTDGFPGKIIVLSGYSDFEYARQALRLSVSDYLSKPISLSTMKTVFSHAISSLEAEQAAHARQRELAESLRRYRPFIEKEWVKSAVAGSLEAAYRHDELLPDRYRYWREASAAVMGVEIVRNDRVNGLSPADAKLFRFALANLVCELAAGPFAAFEYTELYGLRSALVLHAEAAGGEAEPSADRMRRLGAAIIDRARSLLGLELFVGMGSAVGRWQDIPDSTEEAFRAIGLKEQAVLAGCTLFVLPEPGVGGGKAAAAKPVKYYQQLAGAIKLGDEAAACAAIEAYARELGREDERMLPLLAGELWGVVTYSLYESGVSLEALFPERHLQHELAALTTPSKLASWLKGQMAVVCGGRDGKGSGRHRQAVDFLLHYVRENYAEDVTLGDLADKVFISRNYLSNIFKSATGETFNNYLTRVRMEKAKELLAEKKMLVYEVAHHVGYRNVPYFSTLFKKYAGVNPAEFPK